MGERAVPKQDASRLLKPLAQPGKSLLPKGLREKLIVAFSLMSVVPLLVLGYIVTNYVFPNTKEIGDLALVIFLAIFIAILGYLVARNLVLPIVRLASEAQAIAQGNLERKVEVRSPDEIGTLGMALNQITHRVRENMSQLKAYGEQTKYLNLEINKRILTLSHLLQVSNLITQSVKVEQILTFILEKLTVLDEAEFNFLLEPTGGEDAFLIRQATGADLAQVQALVNTKVVAPWLSKCLKETRILVIDGQKASGREGELLQQLFGVTNAVCQPLIAVGQGVGLLISGNRKPDFTFIDDCLDLLKVFGKQMGIAIENDLLAKQAEELKIVDELTGLYNASYMKSRLEEEIRRAIRYHRPCSFILFNLDNFQQFQDLYGGLAAEEIVKQVAELLKGQVSEVDRVGRMGADEFAVILPERNKREAIDLAEVIRHRVEEAVFTNGPKQLSRCLTISGGVSENPLDGMIGEQLLKKASEALGVAKDQGKNRVVAY